ncbi:MAG: TonB-dependent receptor [Balneolaceae bacterium]|nr:TonB-dependent receptor [Balneolaceae bacterium]
MKKYILSTLLVFVYHVSAFSQEITVVDSQSKEPLTGVYIVSEDSKVTRVTDTQGTVSIAAFQHKRGIIFSYLGYKDRRLTYPQIVRDGLVVVMESEALTLGETVVSANRWEQNTREIPLTIQRITAGEMKLQNPQTAADLLGVSNRVFVQKSQMGGGSPMIRGFATNRVLLVVDGIRMNNAIFRSGNLQNVISLDANIIENTEVIFGPGSVMYGSDALGGVMSFNTAAPKLSAGDETEFKGVALTRIASANWENTAHVNLKYGFQKWAGLSSFTYSDFDNMRMGSKGPEEYLRKQYVARIDGKDVVVNNDRPSIQYPTAYRQFNLMQKLRYRPSDDWDIRMGMHYSSTGDIPRYDRLIEKREGQFRKAEWYYGPQQWLMTSISALYHTPSMLFDQAKVTAAYQDFEESRNDRSFGSSFLRNREERLKAYSATFDFEKLLSAQSTLFYGAEAVVNKVHSRAHRMNIETSEKSAVASRYPDGALWQSYALFAKYKNNLNSRWTITAGSRYTRYVIDASFSDRFFDFPFSKAELNKGALTGSIGGVFRGGESWQVNAHISSGFRAPNIDDIGKVFDSEPGSVVIPNPNLSPEHAYNFELGVQKVIDKRLKLDVTAFYTLLDNAMVRRDFTLNGQDSVMYDGAKSQVQAIQNVSGAIVKGIQAGMELRLHPTVTISSTMNFQKGNEEAKEKGQVPLRHVAPTFGSTHINWTYSHFTFDLYADYNGEISYRRLAPSERGKPHLYATNTAGNPHSPAWYTLNLKTSWELSTHLSFYVGLENILDERYRPYSSGITAPGRNVIFSIRANF